MIIAVVTGVSLILAIAQRMLSEQMDPPGEKRGEMQDHIDFRKTVKERIDRTVAPATPLSFLVFLIEAVGQRTRTLEDHDCLPLLFVVTLKHSQLNLVVRVLATERYLQQISCESEIRRQSSDEGLLADGTILVFHIQYMGRTVSSETEGYSRTWFLTTGLK